MRRAWNHALSQARARRRRRWGVLFFWRLRLWTLAGTFPVPYYYKQDLRPAQQEEEAGLAQGKLRRQLRTGRALLALGLSGLRRGRQQSGTGYCQWIYQCEVLNDRLQFSWCLMCP
jgi:hypothetical protein